MKKFVKFVIFGVAGLASILLFCAGLIIWNTIKRYTRDDSEDDEPIGI